MAGVVRYVLLRRPTTGAIDTATQAPLLQSRSLFGLDGRGDSGVEVRGGSKGVGMSHVCGGGEFDLREYTSPIRSRDDSEELFVMRHTLYVD